MRQVVLQFVISLDGYSCDEDTKLWRVMEEIDDPKQEEAEPGGDILAHGGTQFVHSRIRLGLVDQYRPWVLPAATGQGAPPFTGLAHPLTLRLVTSAAFPSGILELVYSPAHHDSSTGGRDWQIGCQPAHRQHYWNCEPCSPPDRTGDLRSIIKITDFFSAHCHQFHDHVNLSTHTTNRLS